MSRTSTSRVEAAIDIDMDMLSSNSIPASTQDTTLESIEEQCTIFQSLIDSVGFSPLAPHSQTNSTYTPNSTNTNSTTSKPKMQTFITSLTLTSTRTVVTDLSTMRLQSQWFSSNEIRRSCVWGRWTREENNWDAGLTRFKRRWIHWCWKWTVRWKWWRPIFSNSETEFGHGQCRRTSLSGVSSRSMFHR